MKGVPGRKYEYIVAWFCWTGTWFVSMTQKVSHCKWMRMLKWNEMNVDQHAWEWKCEWIWKWYDMNMYLRMTWWKHQEMRNEMRNVLWNDDMICDCEMYEKKKEMEVWKEMWNVWKEKRNEMYEKKCDMEHVMWNEEK